MIALSPRPLLRGLLLAVPIGLAGCSLTTEGFVPPAAAVLPQLQSTVAADPSNVVAATRLAVGHVDANRLEEARDVLAATRSTVPADRTVLAMLGIVQQGLGEYAAANERYEEFIGRFPTDPVTPELLARREAIRPAALLEEARSRAGQPVGFADWVSAASAPLLIVPFRHDGSDADGEALAWGLTERMADGLSRVVRPLVDTREAAALLEVANLPEDAPLSLGTATQLAARLGAGPIVYGELDLAEPGRMTLRVTVGRRSDGAADVSGFEVAGALEDAASLQDRATILTLGALRGDVSLTEAQLVGAGGDPSTPALVAFGRGLVPQRRGDLESAAIAFESAAAMAPDFELATRLARRARDGIEWSARPLVPSLVSIARVGELQRSVAALTQHPGSAGDAAAKRIGLRDRSIVAEVLGMDRLGAGTAIDLVFTVPPGAP